MEILQRKLRDLRNWQGLTLAATAARADLDIWNTMRWFASFESGAIRHDDYKRFTIGLAHAYGVVPRLLDHLLDEEYAWRLSARDGSPKALPRLARYLYRPLPEVAHYLFADGFVVLDCETTDKDPHSSATRICEITILDTDGVVLLNSLVNPELHIPDGLTANVHGISDEMVAAAPTFRDLCPAIAFAIAGQTVVAYNANYDCYLLDRLCIEHSLDIPPFDQWCLMEAYKTHAKSERWLKLINAAAREGVEDTGEEAHRSLADTTMTWRLLQKLALQYSV